MDKQIQQLIDRAEKATLAGDHATAGEYHREACDQLATACQVVEAVEQANQASAAYRRGGFEDHADRMVKAAGRIRVGDSTV